MKKFLTRRQALQEAAIGFGAMAVNSMLQQERLWIPSVSSSYRSPKNDNMAKMTTTSPTK